MIASTCQPTCRLTRRIAFWAPPLVAPVYNPPPPLETNETYQHTIDVTLP